MKREYVALFSSISTSEKLADLKSDTHRLFYTWLLAQTDPWGRIEASPRVLNAKVWPMLSHTVDATTEALEDCVRTGLVEQHAVDGNSWIQVPDWEEKAGKLRRDDRCGKSKWPDPTEHSRSTPGVVRSTPSQSRAEEKRVEQSRAEPRGPESRAVSTTRRQASGPHAECIRAWEDGWLRTRGIPWAWQPQDFKEIASALKLGGAHEVQSRITRLLEHPSEWKTENAGPWMLRKYWNQLAVTVTKNGGDDFLRKMLETSNTGQPQ